MAELVRRDRLWGTPARGRRLLTLHEFGTLLQDEGKAKVRDLHGHTPGLLVQRKEENVSRGEVRVDNLLAFQEGHRPRKLHAAMDLVHLRELCHHGRVLQGK